MGEQTLEDVIGEVPKTWSELHDWLTQAADEIDDYAGIPVPVEGMRLTLEPRHNMRDYHELLDLTTAGKALAAAKRAEAEDFARFGPDADRPFSYTCSASDVDDTEWVRNSWWSNREQRWIYLVEKRGKIIMQKSKRIQPATRFDMQLMTLCASMSWNVRAEREAMKKLRSMLPEHLADAYEMTGAFMETSKRSGLTYIFRRARPTVVLRPSNRHDENAAMLLLTVMCMHPIGYYDGSWAGAMVPTDDVIAHLVMMRGDEHLFWKRANQHRLYEPEAGL